MLIDGGSMVPQETSAETHVAVVEHERLSRSDGALGMKKIYKKLFIDIPWGTSAVADITRDRCKELGVKLIELSECWDIDRPSDLKRLNALKDFNKFID